MTPDAAPMSKKPAMGAPDRPKDRPPRVLVIDDDPIVAESLSEFVRAEGYDVATALDGEEGLGMIVQAEKGEHANSPVRPFAVVIADVSMPKMDGMQLLERVAKEHPSTVMLMLTGYGTIEAAVHAVRLGAADYLTKPVVDTELRMALERALRQQKLLEENRSLKKQLDTRFGLDSIVGSDARMLRVYDLIEAVAPTKTTVLMNGESGTGKSLIAHAIHHRSSRASRPFVELACGSIPETLLESELFGHIKGSFTGAHADKVGKFLAADGGTLFLDEINSASPGMQLKLLRVLQEKKFEPVGSNETIEVDVRVILATNQSLEELVQQGKFRQDLYYRINVVKIDLPPLRERVADIPLLVEHFLAQHASAMGRTVTGVDPHAMEAIRRYAFPGNVRELSNVIERAVVLSRRPTIQLEDLPPQVTGQSAPVLAPAGAVGSPQAISPTTPAIASGEHSPNAAQALDEAMREPERRIIIEALRLSGWNRLRAAERLQINRTTLYKKMRALGIDPSHEARAG